MAKPVALLIVSIVQTVLGASLILTGSQNSIEFGAQGPKLTAACDNDEASVLWIDGSLEGSQDFLLVGLANVPPTCATVSSMREPCAAHRTGAIPPLFYCAWHQPDGLDVSDPKHAEAGVVKVDNMSLAVEVTLKCPKPTLLNNANLSVYHFADPSGPFASDAKLLPYKGAPGGNMVPGAPSPPPSSPPLYADCHGYKVANPDATSGIYKINPGNGVNEFSVFCDMDTIKGMGYTVIYRVSKGGCAGCSTGDATGYFSSGGLGGSSIIDNSITSSEFGSKAAKLSDTQINALKEAIGGDNHQFLWYTRGDSENKIGTGSRSRVGYAWIKLAPGVTFTSTGMMKQSCMGKADSEWDDWYTPTTDAGLSLRAHYYQSSNSYYRCYYDGRSCGGTGGCTANGGDHGYFTTRHSTGHYDFCGRNDQCSDGTNVVVLLGPIPPSPPPMPPSPPPPPMQKSCRLFKEADSSAPSGTYLVNPDGVDPFFVHCDMETDGGRGYAVIMRVGQGGCSSCAAGSSTANQAYFNTGGLGGSSIIDNTITNSKFASTKVAKISDTQIDALWKATEAGSSGGHQFLWYTRGDSENKIGTGSRSRVGYAWLKIHPSSAYKTDGMIKQTCKGKSDSAFDSYYTPTTDAGLSLRAHHYQSSNSYFRCYYDGRSCGGTGGCTANGGDNGYFITRHATSYYDFCGRSDQCSTDTNVVLMVS